MEYDAILVGGALVGKVLALVLQSLGWRVVILEAMPEGIPTKKLFALHWGSLEFLTTWLDPHFFEQAGTPIQGIRVSQRGSFGSLRLSAEDIGLPMLGRVIPSDDLEIELMRSIERHGISYFSSTRLDSFVETQMGVEVKIQQNNPTLPETLKSKWIFACDGAESQVRTLAGIETNEKQTQEMALVFRSHWELAHHSIAHEKKISDGVLALLPLTGNVCASIWSGNQKKMQALMQLDSDAFKTELEHSFGRRLGRCQSIQWVGHYPLRWVCAKQRQRGRVILMGNAAHTIFPIAAQGFNMALDEMRLLQNNLKSADAQTVQAMHEVTEQLTQFEKNALGWSSELAALFRWNMTGSKTLFQSGLMMLNCLTPAKRYILNQLMGKTIQP